MQRFEVDIQSIREQIPYSWLAYENSKYEFWNDFCMRYDFQDYILNRDGLEYVDKLIHNDVDQVLKRRMNLIEITSITDLEKKGTRLPTGRILIYSPNDTMFDCLAQGITSFFNEADIPSCQSWLQYISSCDNNNLGYLITWIPSQLVNELNFIVSEMYNGLFWADDSIHILEFGSSDLVCLSRIIKEQLILPYSRLFISS